MPETLASSLEKLAQYRSHNCRASEEIVEKGRYALRKNGLRKLEDDGWAFLEQMTLAAIDIGDLTTADDCLTLLVDRFPESPRVEVLQGIRIEALGDPQRALEYYDNLLQEDESNAAAWKRKIALLRSSLPLQPSLQHIKEIIEELSTYLDTFYTDIEAWLELADIYTSVSQYASAHQALNHAMLLAPQNPFYVLQAAQTAVDGGDMHLALRYYLRAGEMAMEDESAKQPLKKPNRKDAVSPRAWFGVKLCTKRLLSSASFAQTIDSQTPPVSTEHVKLLDELATERLSSMYTTKTPGRSEVLTWLQSH